MKTVSKRGLTVTLSLVLFALAAISTGIGISERMKNALLQQDALETARTWSTYVAKNFDPVENGSAQPFGKLPKVSENSKQDFRYRLHDPDGDLIYDSGTDHDSILTQRQPAEPEQETWSQLLSGESLVRILRDSVGEPRPTYADVFVPIIDNGKALGIVEVNINQTLKANRFDRVFRITAFVTVALVILGVGIPGGLLWHAANARRLVEQRVDYLDQHDSLTGLVNRKTLTPRLSAALATNDAAKHKVGVLSVGIDGFKNINDSLGHHVGDLLLIELADRLRVATRESDVVGRVTGDEFAVIAPGFRSAEEVVELAMELRAIASQPFEAKTNFLSPSISIGIAISPEDGSEAELLIKRATVAQNWAKNEKQGSVRVFDKKMDAAVNHRFTLEMDMRRALENDQFKLLYQPQIDLRTGDLVGCEALVRWEHPELGLVNPDRFIPIAERTGFINELGLWILKKACEDAAAWPKPISVAVNLSPAQFASGATDAMISGVLETTGLDPARLEVEITEGLIINDTEEALGALHKLRRLGVSVAMDDFGTGYSSLSYLTLFPYTKLKIDRSLLLRIDEDPNVASVIRSMVELGTSLDMKVVCEGVETLAQAAALDKVGCGLVQGFLFARPMSCGELAENLRVDLASSSAADTRTGETVAA